MYMCTTQTSVAITFCHETKPNLFVVAPSPHPIVVAPSPHPIVVAPSLHPIVVAPSPHPIYGETKSVYKMKTVTLSKGCHGNTYM